MRSFRKASIFSGLLVVLFAVMVSGLLVSGCANRKIADSKKPGTPATIDGIIVTESEIRSAAAAELESMELRKLREDAAYARTEREALMTALERVLEEKLLALEAAEQGVSKEQLIDREIRSKITEPSDEEIDRVYEANRARVNRPKEDVAEQIKEALRNQSEKEIREEYRGQLEKKRKVVRNLEPYRFDIKTGGRPSLGPDNAPVKLVLFSDFQCPYCSDFSITLMEVVKTYGDKVQLVFMQFPLTNIHPNAQFAAEASLCARDQKNFWKMHDILFENQRALTEENILKQIESLDIDSEIFKECLASGRHKSEIREDIRAAAASGTSSTPTLFINGLYLSGGQPYGLVSAMINQELASAGIEP